MARGSVFLTIPPEPGAANGSLLGEGGLQQLLPRGVPASEYPPSKPTRIANGDGALLAGLSHSWTLGGILRRLAMRTPRAVLSMEVGVTRSRRLVAGAVGSILRCRVAREKALRQPLAVETWLSLCWELRVSTFQQLGTSAMDRSSS